jgi:hypothetical protein
MRAHGLAILAVVLAACGVAPAPVSKPRETPIAWADVFEGPDLWVVVRPRAFRSDPVYGAFFRALVQVALARGLGRGASMVEAAEGAEEIVLGLARGDDAAIVFRGVPAHLDPATMSDSEGRSLFRARDERGRVAEYEVAGKSDGALFVLPDRTWIGALGAARTRARRAFAMPLGHPPPQLDREALAAVSVTGPLAHALDRHPMFGPLGARLETSDLVLKPARGGLLVTLRYADAPAATTAAAHARRLRSAAEKAWIKDAEIVVDDRTVRVKASLPPRLLEELPSASGADF